MSAVATQNLLLFSAHARKVGQLPDTRFLYTIFRAILFSRFLFYFFRLTLKFRMEKIRFKFCNDNILNVYSTSTHASDCEMTTMSFDLSFANVILFKKNRFSVLKLYLFERRNNWFSKKRPFRATNVLCFVSTWKRRVIITFGVPEYEAEHK